MWNEWLNIFYILTLQFTKQKLTYLHTYRYLIILKFSGLVVFYILHKENRCFFMCLIRWTIQIIVLNPRCERKFESVERHGGTGHAEEVNNDPGLPYTFQSTNRSSGWKWLVELSTVFGKNSCRVHLKGQLFLKEKLLKSRWISPWSLHVPLKTLFWGIILIWLNKNTLSLTNCPPQEQNLLVLYICPWPFYVF